MCSKCVWGGTSGALGYAKDNKVLPLAVSEHVLCLWRNLHAVLPAVVMLAVGLGLVVLDELLQPFHLGDQGLYGVPVIRTVAHEHIAPRSRGLLRNVAVDSLLSLGGWSRWLSDLCCLAPPAALATDRARRALRTLAAAHQRISCKHTEYKLELDNFTGEGQEVTLKQANHVPTGSHILYKNLRILTQILYYLTANFVTKEREA